MNRCLGIIIFFSVAGLFYCVTLSSRISIESKSGFNKKKVIVLPLGKNISKEFVDETTQKMALFVPHISVEKISPMPISAYYKPRNRYRADSLIRWLNRKADKEEVYIGITHHDISTTKKPFSDWGVMGLGYQPGKGCVASDFRLKDKKSFWKVAIHELGHTAGLPHCSEKTCLMRDAEGGDQTNEEEGFCLTCKKRLRRVGWKL